MNRSPPDRVPAVLESPLTIADQGSFYAGGQLLDDGAGHTTYASHLYASFQKPMRPRKYPLVMWHGGGQTGKTWESTADGREGYNTLWLRRDYTVFIVDEPYVGRGGKPAIDVKWPLAYWDQRDFESFRRGLWNPRSDRQPRFYEGTRVPTDDWAVAQLQKQSSKNLVEPGVPRPASPHGTVFEALPYPEAPDAGAALFDAVGPAILVSHSHAGFLGWSLALRTDNVRGIVSYEPVRFIFPKGERPAELGVWNTQLPDQREAEEVSMEQFLKLTKFPIQIVYGDFLDPPGTADTKWRDAVKAAEAFRSVVTKHGGDVEILHLPDVGITGNSHFPFADVNNKDVAHTMAVWLRRKNPDAYPSETSVRG